MDQLSTFLLLFQSYQNKDVLLWIEKDAFPLPLQILEALSFQRRELSWFLWPYNPRININPVTAYTSVASIFFVRVLFLEGIFYFLVGIQNYILNHIWYKKQI